MELLFILLLALVIDVLLGEPPRAIHPVVWIGKVASFWERFTPIRGMRSQLLYGGGMTLLTVAIFTVSVYFLLVYVSQISTLAYIIIGALLLKSVFSFRELRQAAIDIKLLLTGNDMEGARAKMSTLVSRETQSLGRTALVSATLESVAENLCDSFVAPLFYFLCFGVPGAVAYRVVNTLDAMIGYHGKYEYLGKCAAKLDDVLNFIPARISGLLLVIASYLCKKDSRNAWQVMLRDHDKTESPNAGWPMSAVAGALRVRLEKAGCYSLGETTTPLSPQLIISGTKLAEIVALLWVSLVLVMEVMYSVFIA